MIPYPPTYTSAKVKTIPIITAAQIVTGNNVDKSLLLACSTSLTKVDRRPKMYLFIHVQGYQ